MESGIYIVTLNNSEPISVNAHDSRVAQKTIKVTRTNCKVGKATNLRSRERSYFKTFGESNVNFMPVALIEDIAKAEEAILTELDLYRMKGRTGRKNEWLEGISAEDVKIIVIETLEDSDIPYELLDYKS